MENNNEVLLKVDHLCQYFRLGHKDLKAVDDVSFEMWGPRGESESVVRFVTGWTTTDEEIEKLISLIA